MRLGEAGKFASEAVVLLECCKYSMFITESARASRLFCHLHGSQGVQFRKANTTKKSCKMILIGFRPGILVLYMEKLLRTD